MSALDALGRAAHLGASVAVRTAELGARIVERQRQDRIRGVRSLLDADAAAGPSEWLALPPRDRGRLAPATRDSRSRTAMSSSG